MEGPGLCTRPEGNPFSKPTILATKGVYHKKVGRVETKGETANYTYPVLQKLGGENRFLVGHHGEVRVTEFTELGTRM